MELNVHYSVKSLLLDDKLQIWIGLFEVRFGENCDLFPSAKGAWVNVLTWAVDVSEFTTKVRNALEAHGMIVVKIEDPEPFSERIANFEVEESLLDLARELESDTNAVLYGDFYTWEQDSFI